MLFLPVFQRAGPRGWRAWGTGLAAAAAAAAAAIATQAATPCVRSAAGAGLLPAGVGDVRVTALFDGVVPLGRNQLVGIGKAQVDALMTDRYVPESAQGMQTAVNADLV